MRSASRLLALLALTGAAACVDSRTPVNPEPGGGGPPTGPIGHPVTVQALQCSASRQSLTVSCASPTAAADGVNADILVGGQGVYVQVTSSNVAYNDGTGQFTFDVTLQNLIEQPMGTVDGSTPDPNGIRVYFHQAPTVTDGTGTASVVPDGFANFTAAGQAYYQFNSVLPQGATSAADTWTIITPPTVNTFQFVLYVSAPVQFPDGYITLNDNLPGTTFGNLGPGATEQLTAVSKSAVGNAIPGTTVTFATTDGDCASVTAGGLVTGVRAATCQITATDGTRAGSLTFTVTGGGRVWTGAGANALWSNPLNWAGNLTPASVDTAIIPVTGNDPVLDADVSIGGVQVADGALLSLATHTLNASENVVSSAQAGSGITSTSGLLLLTGTGKTVQGNLPLTRVTGSYSLSGNATSVAPAQIWAGRLHTGSFLFRASN